MIRIALAPIGVAITLVILSTDAVAQDVSLQQCKSWYNKIEHITDLRRAGGSAKRMDSWKRQRRAYEDKFKEANCRRYGKKVRK